MTKSLIILTLLLNSCASNNSNKEVKEGRVSQLKDEPSLTSKKEMVDSNFLSFWKAFTDVVKNSNQKVFMTMSLDSLLCEQKPIDIHSFVKTYFSKVFDDTLLHRLEDSSKVDFMDYTMEEPSQTPLIHKRILKGKKIIKQVSITKIDNYPEGPVTIVLQFIETIHGYKFYGYDRFG